jgi:myosin V
LVVLSINLIICYSSSRRNFRSDVRHVIYLQSCVRRRLARKELKALKAEARSVSKFKEISYRLENKVVELTQTLQKRTEEKKNLQANLSELEQQLQQWISRHEESDARAKQFQASLQLSEAELSRRDTLLQAKADVERRLEEAVAKALEKEDTIQRLTEDLVRQSARLEQQQRDLDNVPVRTTEDSSVIATLKNEVSSLREQLNRSNTLNALTKGSRMDPPTSPTFAPTLRMADRGGAPNGAPHIPNTQRHQRRHSTTGIYAISSEEHRTSTDEIMIGGKRNQSLNPRAVSVAFHGENNYLRFRSNGLPDTRDFDDPAEEKIRLMQDFKHLDEDVLDGLIRGLKIPAPSLTHPSAVKEILFPANLISLVTNEMWKYGLIPESERFLANVMQTIQSHVMVCYKCIPSNAVILTRRQGIYRRRCYRARNFLAFQCPRNAFFHLRGRKRYASGYRTRRRTCCSSIRLE